MGLFGSNRDDKLGPDAIRFSGRIILQDSGVRERAITLLAGYAEAEARSQHAIDNGFPHELVIGDVIIIPRKKYSGRNVVGSEFIDLATSKFIHPGNWSHQTYPEFHDQWERQNGIIRPASNVKQAI